MEEKDCGRVERERKGLYCGTVYDCTVLSGCPQSDVIENKARIKTNTTKYQSVCK